MGGDVGGCWWCVGVGDDSGGGGCGSCDGVGWEGVCGSVFKIVTVMYRGQTIYYYIISYL